MCSWCWGFQPTWEAMQLQLKPMIERDELVIQPLLGGLAIDSDEPMPLDMRARLESTWQQIESSLGTEFNYEFWYRCQPRRSTYPACRACLVARDEGLEREMNASIQHAYYLRASNPSDMDTLTRCAEQVGMQPDSFLRAMEQVKISARLEQEVQQARQMGLNSFPSFALVANNQILHIDLDYQNPKKMVAQIQQAATSSA